MECKQRLYLTADRQKLVAAGDKRAAFLYASPGDEIPASAAERFRLVDGALPGSKGDRDGKEDRGGADKERKGGSDKGRTGDRQQQQPDDLEALKGVGEKTAKALAAAGLTTFAAIAAIDPASPPAIDGLSAVFKWTDVVASAKDKAPAAEPQG